MDQSCLTVLRQMRSLGQDPVGLSLDPPVPARTIMLSSQARDLEHLHPITVRGKGRLIGEKILNCMESEGVGEPGRRQLQEVEVVKTAVQRKRRKVPNTALKKKAKNQSGVTMKT